MTHFTGIRRIALLVTVFAALLLAGCAPSVVGKWEGNMAGDNPMGISANGSLEFKPDGKFEQRLSMPMGGDVVATGNYTVEGEKLSLKLEDMAAGGKSVKGQLSAEMAKKVLAAGAQTGTFKIEKDTLTLNMDKGKTTLTRAKK